MAESINTQISDRLIERQLQVGRIETGLRREVFAQLALLESEILSSIKSSDPTQWVLLSRRRLEVQRLMAEEVDPLVRERYQHIADLLDAALLRLATNEAAAVQTIINDITQEETVDELPSPAQLRAGVVRGIFPSPATATDFATFGADWWSRQATNLSQRLHDQMLVSVSLEETLTQVTTRVRGTPEAAFSDGIIGKARQDAQRLLATQTTNALGEARAAVAERNPTPLMLVHSSILDSRTSTICISRHGLKYSAEPDHAPIGHSIPYLNGVPYHPNCRSSMLTVLRNGGPVTDESLSAWLRRRGSAFQDAVLGPTRARLFRDAKLSPRQLIDSATGKPLTLEELGV